MPDQRIAYQEALLALGALDERIVVLEADLGKSTMTYAFEQKYPDRYFEMGIAEANMTSFAAGLALTGKIPFTNSFAVFALGRAYDQVRQSIATARLNVKIVGSSAGLSDFGDGATHQAVEDMAIARAIPGMTVLSPADASQVKAMMRWMVAYDGPCYMRLSRTDLPLVTGPSDFPVLPATLREGEDVALVATGSMVSAALTSADMLKKCSISARVVNCPCLKPLSDEAVHAALAGVKAIVTCEEHAIIGGLAQALAWALRGDGRPLEAVAINDQFGQSAQSIDELLKAYRLTPEDIYHTALSLLGKKGE